MRIAQRNNGMSIVLLATKHEEEDNLMALRFLGHELSRLLKKENTLSIDQIKVKNLIQYCKYGQSEDLHETLTSGFCVGSYYRTYLQEQIQKVIGDNYTVDFYYNTAKSEITYTIGPSKETLSSIAPS